MPMTMTPRSGFSGADYWPEEMEPQTFYEPTDRGFEAQGRASGLPIWDEKRRERGTSPDATID